MKSKKTIFGALVLVSGVTMAGTMGVGCQNNPVKLPCAKKGWHFEVDALYLKPVYGTGLYLTTFTNSSNRVLYHDNNPNWSWGFKAGAGYHFGQGNDLTVDWSHHEKNHDWLRRIGTGSSSNVYNVDFNNKWDQVNAELGQVADFGASTRIRYHGGLQYSNASKQFSLALASPISLNHIRSEFYGVGPRTGLDVNHHLSTNFSLFVKGAVGLLVGEKSFRANTAGVIDSNGNASGNKTAIFPEVDGKIGLEYIFPATQGDYFIHAGYQVVNYFNAFTIATVSNQSQRHSDLGLQGAFLGVRYFGYT